MDSSTSLRLKRLDSVVRSGPMPSPSLPYLWHLRHWAFSKTTRPRSRRPSCRPGRCRGRRAGPRTCTSTLAGSAVDVRQGPAPSGKPGRTSASRLPARASIRPCRRRTACRCSSAEGARPLSSDLFAFSRLAATEHRAVRRRVFRLRLDGRFLERRRSGCSGSAGSPILDAAHQVGPVLGPGGLREGMGHGDAWRGLLVGDLRGARCLAVAMGSCRAARRSFPSSRRRAAGSSLRTAACRYRRGAGRWELVRRRRLAQRQCDPRGLVAILVGRAGAPAG